MGAVSFEGVRRSAPRFSLPRLPQPTRFGTVGAAVVVGLVAVGVLGLCIVGGQSAVIRGIEVLAAVLLIWLASAHPYGSLTTLLIYVPLQEDFLPFFLRMGAPVPVVRALGAAMEILVPGLVVAALRNRGVSRRLDRLDKIALGYVAVVTAYVAAPYLLPGTLAATSLSVRLLAWRADAIWVVLFLACRHLRLDGKQWRRLGNVVLTIGALAGAVAVYEATAPSAWLNFLTNVLEVPRYKYVVFNEIVTPDILVTHGSVGGHSFVRVGSILQSPLALGFYLYPALAIGLERLTEHRLRGWSAFAALLAAAGIVVTLTRSALLGALVVVLVIFWRGVARLSPGRVRLGLVLAGIAVLLAPFAGSSAVGERTVAAAGGGQDAGEHGQALVAGFDAVVQQPFGRGLGTAPGIGDRFQISGRLTSEDAYLQVGDEIGAIAMVLFILLLLGLANQLRRAPPNEVVSPNAMYAAACGLIVGGLFLHIWLDYPTALTFWGLAGIALNRSWQPHGSPAPAPLGRTTTTLGGRATPRQVGAPVRG